MASRQRRRRSRAGGLAQEGCGSKVSRSRFPQAHRHTPTCGTKYVPIVVMAGLVQACPGHPRLAVFGMARGGYIYILTNRPHGILYVGVTNDLVRRVFEHRSGFVEGFTKRYGLNRLVYFERRRHPGCHPARAQHQALVARMEGANDCRSKPGLERSLRNHHEVKTWMAGTSPAMTVVDFPIQISNSQGQAVVAPIVDTTPRSRRAMRASFASTSAF
jgi:hypothetical protein